MKHIRSDLEGQMTSPAVSRTPTNTVSDGQSHPPSTLNWAVVTQGFDQVYKLDHVPVQDAKNGKQVWKIIRQRIVGLSMTKRLSTYLLCSFASFTVGTGNVHEVCRESFSRGIGSNRSSRLTTRFQGLHDKIYAAA